MLSKHDARRFPNFRSFKVRGVDEPSWTGRLSVARGRLRGVILTTDGLVHIQPVSGGTGNEMESAFSGEEPTECGVVDPGSLAAETDIEKSAGGPVFPH